MEHLNRSCKEEGEALLYQKSANKTYLNTLTEPKVHELLFPNAVDVKITVGVKVISLGGAAIKVQFKIFSSKMSHTAQIQSSTPTPPFYTKQKSITYANRLLKIFYHICIVLKFSHNFITMQIRLGLVIVYFKILTDLVLAVIIFCRKVICPISLLKFSLPKSSATVYPI